MGLWTMGVVLKKGEREMGCDIHLHVEIKYKGEWIHYAAPNVDRHYWLFGVMAGVRGDEKPIAEPKGLPADISLTTKIDYEYKRCRWHTPSWLNEEEIMELEDRLKGRFESEYDSEKRNRIPQCISSYDLEYGILKGTYFYGNSLVGWKRRNDRESVPDGVENIRLVFWFDN